MSVEDTGEDLIDFEVGSPDLQQGNLTVTTCLLDNENAPLAETLLDSELLRLEQTLQTASASQENSRYKCNSHNRNSVELEQVLITIDDNGTSHCKPRNDCTESRSRHSSISLDTHDNQIPRSSSNSKHLSLPRNLENTAEYSVRSCSSRKNSLDVASALEELDRIINESTNSTDCNNSTDEIDGLVNPEDNSFNIDDCLRELDIYLQGFDTSGSEVADSETFQDLDSSKEQNCNQQLPLDQLTVGVSQGELDNAAGSSISDKLRKLASHSKTLRNATSNLSFDQKEEANVNHKHRPLSEDIESLKYQNGIVEDCNPKSLFKPISVDCINEFKRNNKFRSTIAVNPNVTKEKNLNKHLGKELDKEGYTKENGRPVSADYSNGLHRNNHLRSTIAFFGRNSVPNIRQSLRSLSRRQSMNNNYQPQIDYETDDDNEDIDWSWVQDMVQNENCNEIISEEDVENKETRIEEADNGNTVAINLEECNTVSNLTNDYIADDAISEQTIIPPLDKTEDERVRSTWLRSSMRRLRHFRLPSDPTTTPNDTNLAALSVSSTSTTSTPNIIPSISDNTARSVLPNQSAQRPVSAPIHATPSGLSSDGTESRSRSSVQIPVVSNSIPSCSGDNVTAARVSRSRSSEPNGLRPRSGSESSRSRSRPRSLSSSESSLASSVDSSPSCTPGTSPTRTSQNQGETAAPSTATSAPRRPCDSSSTTTMPEARSPLGQWPHGLSSMLACLGCTLGLFNLSRFAMMTVRFGANFIVQFLILSLVFGVPLFTLQLCLGQQLGAGVIDMWRISPLFQGVGIALLAAQAFIGLYSIVGISWMFIYFRDSFITKQDQYRWAEPYEFYRDDSRSALNGTAKISETVPDYFSGIVLQRHNLVNGNSFGAIKFQVAFNLAVVWMIVFVSLSKGLRSYAKVVYVFTLLPIFGTFVLCAKLLGMTPNDSLHEGFPETSWAEFFLNSKVQSWIAASQEAFFTWGLLGAAVMQLSSHNKHKHLLQRDSCLVIILTITILTLTAFLAKTCVEILHFYGYNYMPNSYERMSTYVFLRSTKEPLPPSLATTHVRYMPQSSFIIGERIIRPGMDKTVESGYQVLRFATELVPATLALLGPTQISPFWAVLFYFILILFGIAQQLAIWHCVITGIMAIKAKVLKSWETTITFFTCTFGFILGLPMTTEFGIFVVYFLDYCIGGAWWLIFVYLLEIIAVFMVRGRPYSGDTVVTALFSPNSGSCFQAWLAPLLSFTWNVILPVAMMGVCITWFKNGNYKELFVWHHAPSLEYWPTWTRQIGSLLQLMPILAVPIVAIIQSYRYLNNGPPDILDESSSPYRIQLLYRPPLDSEHLDDLAIQQAAAATNNNTNNATAVTNLPAEDPPPKYTPPPSYTTATGARIAKLLRQSIRRSVRRIANVLGESSTPRSNERPNLQNIQNIEVPPPDYSAVLVEMNQSQVTDTTQVSIDVTDSSPNRNNNNNQDRINRELSNLQPQGSPLSAADVAHILRSSFRRSTVRNVNRMRRSAPEEIPSGSLSAECLVDGVAPIGQDSLVLDTISSQQIENESKGPDDNRLSVI